MNDITIFNHLGNDIRVMTDEQGEPWFVAKDVCTVLGYVRVSNTITRHVDEDDALKRGIIDEVGREQQTTLINESGLYSLIMSSKLPEAKAEAEIEAQRPVAALGRAIETAEGDLTPSAFGKILSKTIKDMGPNKFCRWLLDNNFAFRNGQGKIIPMQDAVNRGILILTERIDKAGKIRPQLLVTPAGQAYFAGILTN